MSCASGSNHKFHIQIPAPARHMLSERPILLEIIKYHSLDAREQSLTATQTQYDTVSVGEVGLPSCCQTETQWNR